MLHSNENPGIENTRYDVLRHICDMSRHIITIRKDDDTNEQN